MKLCDLHTHSTFSDGTDTPTQIVEQSIARKLRAVALTDHNTTAGLPEFLEAAAGRELEAIAGVEISTGFLNREVHILGLFLERERYAEVEDYLSVINQRKEESNRALAEALNAAGYEICYPKLRERHQGNVNRAVIAAELLKKGYIGQIKEAFRGILSPANGFYTPPERIGCLQAIDFLRTIHAVPVLAHPYVSLTEQELHLLLPAAKERGLAGMETRYSTYTPETTRSARSLAREFGLLESGGSDYHGTNKPDILLGRGTGELQVPFALAQKLSAWKENDKKADFEGNSSADA